jgi:hypothetical protein
MAIVSRSFGTPPFSITKEVDVGFLRSQFEHGRMVFSEAHGGQRVSQYLMRGKHHVTGENEFWIAPIFDLNELYYYGTGSPLSDIGYLKRF